MNKAFPLVAYRLIIFTAQSIQQVLNQDLVPRHETALRHHRTGGKNNEYFATPLAGVG